jgi:hypothetical protein
MRGLGVIAAMLVTAGVAFADDPLPDTHTAPAPPASEVAPRELAHVDHLDRMWLRGARPVDPAELQPLQASRIDQVFRAEATWLRACFAGAILRRPAAFRRPRTLVLAVDIQPDGAPHRVAASTAVTPELDACVVGRVMRLRFPRSGGGARVRYPLVFGAI